MSKNEFDELLLKRLQEEELPYKPEHWDQLARQLPPTLTPATGGKAKPWAIAAGIAAAIALVLATVFLTRSLNPSTDAPDQPSVAQQRPATDSPAAKPEDAPANQLPQEPASNAPETAAARKENVPASALAQQQGNKTPVKQEPLPQNVPVPAKDLTESPQQERQVAVVKEHDSRPAKVTPENTYNSPVTTEPKKSEYTYHADPAIALNNYDGKKERKTSVSLGGGVNYGNMNTGYTAGISVRHKIAGNLFVDGTVAMMYNNNANNVLANNGPPMGENYKVAARPTAFTNETALASPAVTPIQKLYYVQFNPSIGYQVEKHIALSVGGDFQRMLNRNDEIVQPENVSSRLFPNMDVGLTAKTEFSITPNIQAGLMFREGLNNLLRNDGTKYVNRRYVQVQFKYNIPVN